MTPRRQNAGLLLAVPPGPVRHLASAVAAKAPVSTRNKIPTQANIGLQWATPFVRVILRSSLRFCVEVGFSSRALLVRCGPRAYATADPASRIADFLLPPLLVPEPCMSLR
jgi:hypothetical protein